MSDTMCRLYLELSQVVPDGTKTERELKLEARVAELEADLRVVHDLRDGQTKYLEQQDKHLADLQAQLERAKAEFRSENKAKLDAVQVASALRTRLDRATEPRADGMDVTEECRLQSRSIILEHIEKIMGDTCGTLINAVRELKVDQEPRPMSEAPRVWSGPGTHITVDVWKYGWTPTGPRWRGAHHRLSTGEIFVLMTFDKPEQPPAGLLAVCSKVDWLPTSSGGEGA